MKRNVRLCIAALIAFILAIPFSVFSQFKLWTEADRQYLYSNLQRSRDELIKETEGLAVQQWRFKESPDRWSINEVVEHLAIYELIFDRQISQSLSGTARPEFRTQPDSVFLKFIMEEKPHHSAEYTKPFSFTVPMGMNDLNSNLAWFLRMRNESIEYVRTTRDDLRAYFLTPDRPNVHQVYIYAFGHVDRGLRQIRKIKQHPEYPK
jgi:hypothetical protein